MEMVKDYTKFTEIGGVYVNRGKKGGWKLILDDKDTVEEVNAFPNRTEIQFYIDTTVDKDIQPLNQMQPHVIIRPRENIVEASAKKVVKRMFVTTHQLQQQKKKKSNNQQKDEKTPVLLKDRETISEIEKGNPSAKRKLELEVSHSSGDENFADNVASVQSPGLIQYEKERNKRIKEIDDQLQSLGIKTLVDNLKNGCKEKEKVTMAQTEDEEDEYVPDNEVESSDSEHTSKRLKTSKTQTVNQGPRTRSRINAEKDVAPTIEKNDIVTSTKKVATSKSSAILKPTCTKVFGKSIDGEAPGSVQAYMALRERQQNNVVDPIESQNLPETNMAVNDVEAVKPVGSKKLRGRTKMVNVHGRSNIEDKVVITLDVENHPIGPTANELSNFVGTLARDNISLTYINWHLVPDELKEKLWKYTKGKYIIPDEAEEWVYKTLNDTWRNYKSRTKTKHYTNYETDEERIKNRPEDIPLEDFKMLVKYWGDKEVKALAEQNASHRTALTETHTMGPKSMAQVKDKLKKSDPNLASPSNAHLFLETRARKEGRIYKSNVENLKKRFSDVQRLVDSGQVVEADELVKGDKKHGPNWLKGRKTTKKSSKSTSTTGTDCYVQELSAKIKSDLENDIEAKVNRKVQENMTWMLKRLEEVNPGLNINIGHHCAVTSSDQDDMDTPLTQGGGNS